jgi:ankyrin repeat protein
MREYNSVDDVLDAVWDVVEFGGYQERPTVKSIGIFGSTPLFAPITWGDVKAVRLLLDAGIDCNAQRERGETALHHAIRMGKFDIARMLLAHGADPRISTMGRPPMTVAGRASGTGFLGRTSSLAATRRHNGMSAFDPKRTVQGEAMGGSKCT